MPLAADDWILDEEVFQSFLQRDDDINIIMMKSFSSRLHNQLIQTRTFILIPTRILQ